MIANQSSCSVAFQSTLPYGSDRIQQEDGRRTGISIHAPLRERHRTEEAGQA